MGLANDLAVQKAAQARYEAAHPYITAFNKKYPPFKTVKKYGLMRPVNIPQAQPAAEKALAIRADEKYLFNQLNSVTVARSEALKNSLAWQQALNEWNSNKPFTHDIFENTFNRLNSYFTDGRASRGRLTTPLAISAFNRWVIDERPSQGWADFTTALTVVAAVGITAIAAGAANALYAGAAGPTAGGVSSGAGVTGTEAIATGSNAVGVGVAGTEGLTTVQAASLVGNQAAIDAYAAAGMISPTVATSLTAATSLGAIGEIGLGAAGELQKTLQKLKGPQAAPPPQVAPVVAQEQGAPKTSILAAILNYPTALVQQLTGA